MRITSYGLFWRESEIEWHPGQGNKHSFRLLGRLGANRGTLQMVDFRHQQGIYVLHDEYGPCYVGLTRDQGLGKRLKDHKEDRLSGKWDRFSWFGFRPIGQSQDRFGLLQLTDPDTQVTEDTHTTIGDLEALLIRLLGPKLNSAWMKFESAEKWEQVSADHTQRYLRRLFPL